MGKKRKWPRAAWALAACLLAAAAQSTRADAAGKGIEVTAETEIVLSMEAAGQPGFLLHGEGELYELAEEEMAHRTVTVSVPDAFTMSTPKGEMPAPDGTEVAVSGVLSARRGYHNLADMRAGGIPDGRKTKISVSVPLTEDFLRYGAGEYSMRIPVVFTYGEDYGSYDGDYRFTPWDEMAAAGGVTVSGTEVTEAAGDGIYLEIPPGVTALASGFLRGSAYRDVWVPPSVAGSSYAFRGSAVKRVAFGEGFSEIPAGICRAAEMLEEAEVPEGVTKYGNDAFRECAKLKEAPMPETLAAMGTYTFAGCTGLGEADFPASLGSVGAECFEGCAGLRKLTVKSDITVTDNPVLIYGSPFDGTALEEVVFAEGVTSVGKGFLGGACGRMTSLSLPETLKRIRMDAFKGCTSMETLELPESLTTLGGAAFAECTALKELTVRSNLKTEEMSTGSPFLHAGLERIVIAEGVTSVPGALFESGCADLESLYLPRTLKTLGSLAFNGASSLRELTIRSDIRMNYVYFRDGAFRDSGLERITVADGVTALPGYIFTGGCANLKELHLPGTIVSIGPSAFDRCPELGELELPASLKSVGEYAFRGAESLKEIHIRSNLKVTKDLYTASPFAASGAETVVVENGVTALPDYLFDGGCADMAALSLPDTLKTIGAYAFRGCTGLRTVALPASLKTVGRSAFAGGAVTAVVYAGTESQWEAVELNGWTPESVTCGDGSTEPEAAGIYGQRSGSKGGLLWKTDNRGVKTAGRTEAFLKRSAGT
ncbi:MAG: leucine-rich repeat domain-containing protein [Lachnospiraceae bacterium]|nr:leucine-rich repeat domain-containing protein [Lachnospiraceae bacterium]